MDEFFDYLKTLSLKDVAPAILGGIGALALAVYTQWGKKTLTREERAARDVLERDKAKQEQATAQGQDLTARFKALMDGYEGRIKDVTTDLAQTRIDLAAARLEIERVRAILAEHQDRCRACPYYSGLEPTNAG